MLANSAVRAGIGITTAVGRSSTGSIVTWTGLTSVSQKNINVCTISQNS